MGTSKEKELDIQAAKRLKNTMWTPALKEFYEPEDVLRYYDELERIRSVPQNQRVEIIEPEKFFTGEVLKEGHILLKSKKLNNLIQELGYLQNVKIPKIQKEIEDLSKTC